MKQFKVKSLIDKGNGLTWHTGLFIKAKDATEAESKAKYYWIIDQNIPVATIIAEEIK